MNAVNINNLPIKTVDIIPARRKEAFENAIPYLEPGDIFTLNNSSHMSSINDGLYIVREKDKANDGVLLSEISPETEKTRNINRLATQDSVDGNATVIGHLDIKA
ncbi:TPA: hypothetical protein IAD52_05810 [Candidatus Spyradomonas excrementavium]|nr:hypothetical protein [Candidatus Spyradomonas excrementavium]